MLFNSYVFIFGYLPVTLVGFFLLAQSSHRLAALWLAAASLFFYGWWNPEFVLLLMTSITANYSFGYTIGHSRVKSERIAKIVLATSVVVNLGVLAYFKYANFFIANVSQLTGMEMTLMNVVLPLGISFFTFTQIAFLVDVYRGIAREYNFIHYVLFVTYFPHLIAGPVLHHKQMMPQFSLAKSYGFNWENISFGLGMFSIGLAKKVLLADQFGVYANSVFSTVANGGSPSLVEAWIGTLAYTMQLYFDFSAYSDMAIGLSRMFNINLPLNFDSPYKAKNIIDFWRRWHMTLSAFLRDYLYVPLGGNRKGASRRYANLMITMLLGGLWHGAEWTFVIWGGAHGLLLVCNHVWRWSVVRFALPALPCATGISRALTFIAVAVAWIPFRSSNIEACNEMILAIVGLSGAGAASFLTTGFQLSELLVWFPLGLLICLFAPNSVEIMEFSKTSRAKGIIVGLWTGVLFSVSLLSFGRKSDFLYFQF
jgi:alginate O-acetyltransferase complex protein AlgI